VIPEKLASALVAAVLTALAANASAQPNGTPSTATAAPAVAPAPAGTSGGPAIPPVQGATTKPVVPPSPLAAPPAVTCVPGPNSPCRIKFTLLKLPPSRVWCSVEGSSGATAVFDPAQPERVTTTTVVSESSDVRCYSDPAPRTVQVGDVSTTVDLGWDLAGTKLPVGVKTTVKATVRTTVIEAGKDGTKEISVKGVKGKDDTDVLEIELLPRLSTADAIAQLEAHAARSKEGRLFGEEFSAVLKDTLELLAEIAAERAKSKGARLIEKRLQTLLCDELRYEFVNGRLQSTQSDRGKLLLPNLCTVARNVPLTEMIESAPKIARALQLDVYSLGFDLAERRLELALGPTSPDWALMKTTLIRLRQVGEQLVANRQFTAADAQALVLELSRDFATAASDGIACDFALAFAVAGVCQARSDGCGPKDIVSLLRDPKSEITFSCTPSDTWTEASTVVVGALNVLNPPAETTPRAQYRSAAVLAFDLVSHVVRGLPTNNSTAKDRKELAEKVLTHSRALTLAVFDEETRVAAMHGLELVRLSLTKCAGRSGSCDAAEKLVRAVEKVTPLLVAFTANAESLKQEAADPDQRKALREARKQTLEAVIDASTQRARRGRDHIVSAGANVGVRYGYLHGREDDDRKDSGNLSLPMGIAYQYLPPSDNFGLGFHSQVSFVDLAQFLGTSKDTKEGTAASSSIEWNDFVLVGAQLGLALGTSENTFTLSADVRYFPSGRMRDAWFVGGAATYYVPFFDFN